MKKIAIVLTVLLFSFINVNAGDRDVHVDNGESYNEIIHVNMNCVISW